MDNDRRRKGLYLRCLIGIRKGLLLNRRIVFLTLTTNSVNAVGLSDKEKMSAVQRDWNVLLTYLRQEYDFEHISVITNEGSGVVHVLFIGLPFISWVRLCRLWNSCHGMGFVWISKFRGSAEGMAGYMMSQYLANQKCEFHYRMSKQFICQEFMKYWKAIKNCSRDYMAVPQDVYGNLVYPIKSFELLKSNLMLWLRYLVRFNERLEYIPNHFDLNGFMGGSC